MTSDDNDTCHYYITLSLWHYVILTREQILILKKSKQIKSNK